MEEQYYSAALVLCGSIWNIRINTVSLYTVVSEIYSRNISLFSCNALVVEVADQRGAVLSIVNWLST